ncbi:MAG: phosphatase PAP2 family protein [Alphaproteobacteria bacterium]|nr:phosphatase PAP2 family protein [Alphaproteobacteria bacterium]
MVGKQTRGGIFFLAAVFIYTGIFTQQTALAQSTTEKVGGVLSVLIPAVGLGTTYFYEKGNEGTIQFFEAMITSQIITRGLKLTINKTRPNGACCDSFPSGHASAAFAGAAFIQRRYGWKYGIPAYLGAAFVGYSRVQSDEHYTIDVVAAAAIGILSSYYFTTSYKGFQITPLASNGIYGVNITKRW